jgi:hypothetical protein
MSSSCCPLTLPEQDALAWYRLGPDPGQHPIREIASIPVFDDVAASDSAELVPLPEAA